MFSKPISQHIILTYGPSRTGKSSFINTIVKAEVTPVGSSNNESTTLSVNAFEADLTCLRTNPTTLRIFDVPGKYDSRMRMTNTEIKLMITETVVRISDTDQLSAILIFDSLSNQPTQLRSTLSDLEFMLGPKYKKSAIVVLTKADGVKDPDDLAGAKQTAQEICDDEEIPFICLKNNHKKFTLNDAEFNDQYDNLMDKIKSLDPYLLKELHHYQNKIKELAKHLELTLPKNKKNVQIDYDTQELKTEVVSVEKTRMNFLVSREKMGGPLGWLGFSESVVTTCPEKYMENETRYHTQDVTKTMNQEMELEYDASYYFNLAKEQILKEIRDQYRKN